MPSRKVATDWSWVSEVPNAQAITSEHVRRAAGLQNLCFCARKKCTSPYCHSFKNNPVNVVHPDDPEELVRKPDMPVGLRNLGATCYANAFIQVWFRDRILRSGVYSCKPSTPNAPIHHLATTFAALEHSTSEVYNPSSLVESLRLEKGSQQDASEFSKLFMSLIARELESQSDPALKTVIKDRFEGKLAYSTLCRGCGADSERESERSKADDADAAAAFTELELGLDKDQSLADRLQALLADEALEGDNKYRCSNCGNLCDAIRRIKIKRLPPVLHFSLLRFVFDPHSFSRKKCKDNISFPGVINMRPFVEGAQQDDWYELSAIVTHRGPNAQHGHFVCEVYDVELDKWFLCNDEEVKETTKPGNLSDKVMLKLANGKFMPSKKRAVAVDDDGSSGAKRLKTSPDSHQKQAQRTVKLSTENQHSSKDAYLLLYTRREDSVANTADLQSPSAEILASIEKLNQDFKAQISIFADEVKAIDAAARGVEAVRDTVFAALLKPDEPRDFVVGTKDLQKWFNLEVTFFEDDTKPVDTKSGVLNGSPVVDSTLGGSTSAVNNTQASETEGSITHTIVNGHEELQHAGDPAQHSLLNGKGSGSQVSGAAKPQAPSLRDQEKAFIAATAFEADNTLLMCGHGQLSVYETSRYKLITESAMTALTECGFLATPSLKIDDLCRQCVVDEFEARQSKDQRTEELRAFNELVAVEDGTMYSVSKAWLTNWRKMTLPNDKATGRPMLQDVEPYMSQVKCHHGAKLDDGKTSAIPQKAYDFLQSSFPGFSAHRENSPDCSICTDSLSSNEDAQEIQAQVKLEKNRLKLLTKSNLDEKTLYSMDEPIYLLPCEFVDRWRAWQQAPQRSSRPTLDTSSLFCEHDLLRFDPRYTLLVPPVCWQIAAPVWETLTELYGSVREVCVQIGSNPRPGQVMPIDRCSVRVCEPCRREEASQYQSTAITVYLHDTDTDAESLLDGDTAGPTFTSRKPQTYGRQAAKRKRSRPPVKIKVTKGDTVMDIKKTIAKACKVQPWLQRLFLCGAELNDTNASTTSIGLLSTDRIHMLEVGSIKVDDDFEMLDADQTRPRADDEGGFGGTALVGGALPAMEWSKPVIADKICPACTYVNDPSRTVCEMCETKL